VAEDVFPDGRQIVDWFHATGRLAAAAHALYPEQADAQKRQRWLKTMKDPLYQGHIHKIINALQRRTRPELTTYFERHQRRMQDPKFRKEGWPIGLGGVESGIKQYKQRLTTPGMRWSRAGAERMLVIRGGVMNNSIDTLWTQAA
jgi:hypothetical protein